MNNEFNNYCGSLTAKSYCRAVFVCAVLLSAVVYASLAGGRSSATTALSAKKTYSKSNQANDSNRLGNPLQAAATDIVNIPDKVIKSSKKGLDDVSETSGYILEGAIGDVNNWPNRIIEDVKESFLRPDNLSIILLAGGASVALHSSDTDDKVADNFRDHHSFHGFTDEGLNVAGDPWTHFGASALWYAVSKKNHDDLNTERAKSMLAALAVTNAATFSLKVIRNNDSPNGKDWAWPSGHTASSFTIASMLDEFYGPNVGVPAYAFASLIAYRMLDTGDHWTSDVVFGAAIGWVVGHTFADRQKQLEIAGFKVLPYTAPYDRGSVVGVNLVKRF